MMTRRHTTLIFLATLSVQAALISACDGQPDAPTHHPDHHHPDRLNVLLICVDDLRPELGCYGIEHARTPNLDRFASTARRFDRHYVCAPTCGASRAALLTGRSPTTPRHLGNDALRHRMQHPDTTSLPRTFRDAGYRTATLGKVEHWPIDPPSSPSDLDDAWTDVVRYNSAPWGSNKDAFFAYADGTTRVRGTSSITEFPDVPDDAYPDARIADAASDALTSFADTPQPFFLAVGFMKPHLPFAAPRRYWDLYDDVRIADAPSPSRPAWAMPPLGWRQSGEVTGNYGHDMWDDRSWDEAERAMLRRSYLACVSYVDAQIGRVLASLDELDLTDSTIVVIWGDHGWHLGDLGLFGKHTLYEWSLRSPLMIRVPGMRSPGIGTTAVTSTLDVFPTLVELCDLPPLIDHADGVSLAPVLMTTSTARPRHIAESRWRHGATIGVSHRSARYRLTTWRDGEDGPIQGIVALDHRTSPPTPVIPWGWPPRLVPMAAFENLTESGGPDGVSHQEGEISAAGPPR